MQYVGVLELIYFQLDFIWEWRKQAKETRKWHFKHSECFIFYKKARFLSSEKSKWSLPTIVTLRTQEVGYAMLVKTGRINQVYFHLDIPRPAAKMRRIIALWGGGSKVSSASGLILNQFVSTTSSYFGFSLILFLYPWLTFWRRNYFFNFSTSCI